MLHKVIYHGTVSAGRVQPTIVVSAGMLKSVRVPIGSMMGRIFDITVRQIAGAPVSFDVELLESQAVHHQLADPAGERAFNAAPAVPIELYRVVPRQAAAPGAAVEWKTGQGFAFYNLDAPTHSPGSMFLYLTIIPQNATGVTQWAAAITAEFE